MVRVSNALDNPVGGGGVIDSRVVSSPPASGNTNLSTGGIAVCMGFPAPVHIEPLRGYHCACRCPSA